MIAPFHLLYLQGYPSALAASSSGAGEAGRWALSDRSGEAEVKIGLVEMLQFQCNRIVVPGYPGAARFIGSRNAFTCAGARAARWITGPGAGAAEPGL